MAEFSTKDSRSLARIRSEHAAISARLNRRIWYPIDPARSTLDKVCLITPGGHRSVARRDTDVVRPGLSALSSLDQSTIF